MNEYKMGLIEKKDNTVQWVKEDNGRRKRMKYYERG